MKTVVCFGDSNTWGYDANGGARFPKNVRWAGKLSKLLGEDYDVCEEGLNGRTSAFSDPLEPHRNGAKHIEECMLVNAPVDLLIIALGTNDSKVHLAQTEYTICKGIEVLLKLTQKAEYGNGKPPEILIVSPVEIGDNVLDTWLKEVLDEKSIAKVKKLPPLYEALAKAYGCYFLDASLYAKPTKADAVHLDEAAHGAIADAVASKIKEIFNG